VRVTVTRVVVLMVVRTIVVVVLVMTLDVTRGGMTHLGKVVDPVERSDTSSDAEGRASVAGGVGSAEGGRVDHRVLQVARNVRCVLDIRRYRLCISGSRALIAED
jgi:hypothetical protein